MRAWQQTWQDSSKGSTYCSVSRRQPLWGPTWKPTKLLNTDQTVASTIHQLWLGHGYFRSFLVHLPQYSSLECKCSERTQDVKHLLLGCPLYQGERQKLGITRGTTLHSLLFTGNSVAMLEAFIQLTWIATQKWLLQGVHDREDEWGWGDLREETEQDGEEVG